MILYRLKDRQAPNRQWRVAAQMHSGEKLEVEYYGI